MLSGSEASGVNRVDYRVARLLYLPTAIA